MLDTDADVILDAIPGWSSLADDGSELPPEETPVQLALDTGRAQRRVVGLQRPDASRSWFEVSARPLTHPKMDTPYAVVVSCNDVTERRELELHLTDLAARDPLTGLWNRRRFEQDVAQQLARCGRYDERATLLVLDIDGFKQVNDTLGHLTGDDVLRAIADALRARLRVSDSAARLGGDEFAVLLLNAGEEEVAAVAADLKERLMKAARTVQDRIALSLSIGVASLDGLTEGVEEALAAADRAMYAQKQRDAGRTAAGIAPATPAKLGVASDLETDGLAPVLAALRSLARADVAWLARATVTGSVVESAFDGQDTVGVVPGLTFPDGRPPQAGAFLSVAMGGSSTLCVARRDAAKPFGVSDRELVESFAPVAADQLRRDGVLRAGTELASLRALLAAVNARDSYTGGHSRQVVTLARAVASRMGLEDAAINEVEHVALLHDLGKIAIPDSILRKPGALTEHEEMLMRQHPVVGGEIVASTPELAHLAPAIRAEHERWDGSGYPDGLAGERIPIASRITFVCDAYHAMTSHRPYRRALSGEEARAEIARAAGSQFCPVAAEALLDVLSVRSEAAIVVG
jgi:diguanylate cyclase (GGDEF)-like protein